MRDLERDGLGDLGIVVVVLLLVVVVDEGRERRWHDGFPPLKLMRALR